MVEKKGYQTEDLGTKALIIPPPPPESGTFGRSFRDCLSREFGVKESLERMALEGRLVCGLGSQDSPDRLLSHTGL